MKYIIPIHCVSKISTREAFTWRVFNVIRIVLNGSQRVPSKIVQIKLSYNYVYCIDDTKQV